ncbi:MAG: PEP/pyruvate-binding domain-containing protein [Prolixibacteraceae bacterium]
MKKLLLILLFEGCFLIGYTQLFIGTVYDQQLQEPIANALVRIEGSSICSYTNASGEFSFSLNQFIEAVNQETIPSLQFQHSSIVYLNAQPAQIRLINLSGKTLQQAGGKQIEMNLIGLPNGIYLLFIDQNDKKSVLKVRYQNREISSNPTSFYLQQQYHLVLEKENYQTGYFLLEEKGEHRFNLLQAKTYNEDYLESMNQPDDFRSIETKPLNPFFGEVTSVKFLYEITTGKIFYINAKIHRAHSYFAMDVLNYPKNNEWFNQEQYRNNANRLYYPGTIDYFRATGKYVVQFFASDDISCKAIETVYTKIVESTFLDNELYYYANSLRTQGCTNLPSISSETLFSGQNYQCLNPEEGYGYLRKVDFEQLAENHPGRHDIVVLNGIPVDVPVVAGIITSEFQTPLSHINVLSMNRKTPNMALRDAWNNERLNGLFNKLVYLNTNFENFEIREASLDEALSFWETREPNSPAILSPDLLTKDLIDASDLSADRINVVGGKAANFGELTHISSSSGAIPLPEGAFAIPFYYYHQHLLKNGLDTTLTVMLEDKTFYTDVAIRQQKLEELRTEIMNAPIDNQLLKMVEDKMNQNGEIRCRFRSSTNAEDIEGFNGAGLYDSKTGIVDDEEKSVADAIREVWASLWNYQAFEERDFFRIDQKTVAMGILVHRSFPTESANGVLITKNIYRDGLPAYTINSQFDEISVVNPTEGWFPEQVLYYTFSSAQSNPIDFIAYSNVPWYNGQTVLTNTEYQVLYQTCNSIQNHYYKLGIYNALDIEFKIDKDANGIRKLYIKQCRTFND